MADNGPFVATVDTALAGKMIADLQQQGFEITKPQYTLFTAKKKGVSCTLYQSGKLTVQGKDKSEFIQFYLEPEVLKDFSHSYPALEIDASPRIGIDESGKGDFFGPLCIAGLYAGGDDVAKLQELGVRDSKTLTDATALRVAKKLKESYIHHIVKINPQKYNELYSKFKNLNRLLAWGHATVIEELVKKTQCSNVIVDQFAAEEVVDNALKRKGITLSLQQMHRAEADLVVAAASILARATFLEGLEQLGKKFGILLPKGASKATIEAGREFIRKHGQPAIDQVGKLHFKTLDAIIH
ncbi:MAG: ribonuclease HIII [Chlamydiales bacterium]|nr:ribonuclease HIII [Chlamydiia bacterium]MCP5508660.1 ribonuclease HIII [Chlamydiales bacterium]